MGCDDSDSSLSAVCQCAPRGNSLARKLGDSSAISQQLTVTHSTNLTTQHPMRMAIGTLLVALAVVGAWVRFDFAVSVTSTLHLTVSWWWVGLAGLALIGSGVKWWR